MKELARLTCDAVDEALVEALFSASMSGRPVYAVPDAEVIDEVASRLRVPIKDALRLLQQTAAIQVGIRTGEQPFAKLAHRLHSAHGLDTPPGLTTLAMLSLAADRMHAEGDMAANNYYGRLHELLDTPDARKFAVENGYRDHAEDLWNALNSWLEAWEGERGVPTAYVVGQWRFVGLPLSQALVRRADREKLAAMFTSEGLPPGYRISPSDMEATLDSWVPRVPPLFSHAFRTLWTNPMARERITAVACLELENWDGSGLKDGDHTESAHGRVARLLVELRKFPRTSLGLDLTFPIQADGSSTLIFNGVSGPEVVALRAAAGGSSRLDDNAAVDMDSVLTDELEATDATGTTYRRRPRRVVPLRFDELQQAWVEEECAQLGETTLVLSARELDKRVGDLLNKVARPGWQQLSDDTNGLPQGWSAFRDVEILDRVGTSIHIDLLPLLPRSAVSLVLSGGLVLPGLLRKWSSLLPPEIHATSSGAASIGIQVHRGSRVSQPADVVVDEASDGGVLVVDLAGRELCDGEYLVTVVTDGATKPSATALLRLRSSETPEIRRVSSRLVYGPSSGPLWPMTAVAARDEPGVDGARVSLDGEMSVECSMPPPKERARRQKDALSEHAVRIGLGLGTNSCMRTGMHRIDVPPALPGIPATHSVEGVCATCGLVKRYPTTAAGADAKQWAKARKTWQPPDLSAVPRIRVRDDGGWGPAFDALSHLGNGTPASLSRILTQMDGSPLGVDVLVRSLESLGHVDLVRDPRTLNVVEWEITPSTLVSTGRDCWTLIGRRTTSQCRQLLELAAYVKADVVDELDDQVPRVQLTLDLPALIEIVEVLQDDWPELVIVHDPARRLASALPALSSIVAGLARTHVPAITTIEVWDTEAADWVVGRSIEAVGAYRLTHHGRAYVVRDDQDLASGTVTLANAQLSKHLANLWAGDPLARFDAVSGSVVVPIGADLPGLYARALCLASGRLAVARQDTRLLQYPDVPRDLADVIHDRLTS
jgi:hypothetical protein